MLCSLRIIIKGMGTTNESPRGTVEHFYAEMLNHKFSRHLIAYEKIAFHSPDFGEARPDFDVYLRNRTLVIEVTAAPFDQYNDPKGRQRKILETETVKTHRYAWSILYLQHCVTESGISVASACLDSLARGENSLEVQRQLDAFAIADTSTPPLYQVPWQDLYRSTFGYLPANATLRD